MAIYDINFQSTIRQLLPPDKRGRNMKAWLFSILKPLQWLRDLWMGDYRTGSSGTAYLTSTTYSLGARVIYKGSAYESNFDGNTNRSPLDTFWWTKVQDNFVGVFERIMYTGNSLVFLYAINKYFGTTYRQPNNQSDIYFTAYPKPRQVFLVGGSVDNSSNIYSDHSTEFIMNVYDFNSYVNMTIFVPVAVYNALDNDPNNRDSIIRNFASRLIIAGVKYSIQTY